MSNWFWGLLKKRVSTAPPGPPGSHQIKRVPPTGSTFAGGGGGGGLHQRESNITHAIMFLRCLKEERLRGPIEPMEADSGVLGLTDVHFDCALQPGAPTSELLLLVLLDHLVGAT